MTISAPDALEINIDQQRANTLGISNLQIGRVAQAAFHEIPVTELREGDHLVPVVIRMRVEERNETERIRTLYVRSLRDEFVPLDNFAAMNLKPEYATIAHFNKLRTITVTAYSHFGELPSRVLARAGSSSGHAQRAQAQFDERQIRRPRYLRVGIESFHQKHGLADQPAGGCVVREVESSRACLGNGTSDDFHSEGLRRLDRPEPRAV